ncbi:Pycsar system effector family protein [Streptomyces sp. NPDC051366]|uniref:Pycsar system effector family protein n=1 Tax=Streptomyces sp. NPDC051366 TaxID=3365652 RepID=UPI00378C2A35
MTAARPEPGPALSEPGARLIAERLLASVREEIARADAKASILLSGAVALPALLVSAGQARLGSGPAAAAGAAAWLAGIAMLALVILPRTGHGRGRSGGAADPSVATLRSGTDSPGLTAAVVAAGADPGRWMLEQCRVLGTILAVKYRWMRAAVCCLLLGAAAFAAALW